MHNRLSRLLVLSSTATRELYQDTRLIQPSNITIQWSCYPPNWINKTFQVPNSGDTVLRIATSTSFPVKTRLFHPQPHQCQTSTEIFCGLEREHWAVIPWRLQRRCRCTRRYVSGHKAIQFIGFHKASVSRWQWTHFGMPWVRCRLGVLLDRVPLDAWAAHDVEILIPKRTASVCASFR